LETKAGDSMILPDPLGFKQVKESSTTSVSFALLEPMAQLVIDST